MLRRCKQVRPGGSSHLNEVPVMGHASNRSPANRQPLEPRRVLASGRYLERTGVGAR